MAKLSKTKKRTKLREELEISKQGEVKRKGKKISKAYEKKYSEDILQLYSKDDRGRYHNKKGRFVSNKAGEKYEYLVEVTKTKRDKKLKAKEVTYSERIEKGRFMSKSLAITYECTCYIHQQYTTNPDERKGRVIQHYYTISSNNYITNQTAKRKHDKHFPDHELLNIEHTSTKVLSFE